jgi:DNA-binding CsgD family transcriptional regulator
LLLADEIGTWAGIGLACGVRARIAIHRGDLTAAKAAVAEAEPAVPTGYPVSRAWIAWCSSLILEAEGDITTAVNVLAGAWAALAPIRYFIAYRSIGPDLVRLALAAAERERALAVARDMEEGARRSGVSTAVGAALRCRGLVDGDVDALRRSVDAYRDGPRPLDLAFACEDAGVAIGSAGGLEEGRGLLEEALQTYEGAGAARDVARANAALRALGIRRRRGRRRKAMSGWESLTESELRVAKLAAEGLTNRQIGERLFVSRRTVETHLKHIFQKLHLSTRAQLAGEAARQLG